ncbi:MAG: ribonuclease III family protein [Candidatus Lokiarchaeota archaeon]|nr:ribonuclease III family protein [Candidatus Lokiarchaeota archaeon]
MELAVIKRLKQFQKYIDYEFNEPKLLYQALVTPHYGNEKGIPHYEILETLGDAVIKLIFSLKIYLLGENDPGKLTQIKQRLEDNTTFIRIGNEMGLPNFIFPSINQKIKDTSIIADVFEAVCGAIYLDSGKNIEVIEQKIINRFFNDWEIYLKESPHLLKNQLLEFLQEKFKFTPKIEYDYEKFGPDNDSLWVAKNPKIFDNKGNLILNLPIYLKSKEYKTKKEAEKELSAQILEYLKTTK